MKGKLGCMLVLAAASLAMLGAGASTASAAVECESITGAGSSLQKVAQQEVWITGFTNSGGWWEGLCLAKPTITYNSTSSGKGKEQWGYENEILGTDTPFEAYIGTDLAPTLTQIEKMGKAGVQPTAMRGTMSVPVAQSAISVVVSLPTNCHPKSGSTVAEISSTKLKEEWETGGKTFTEYIKNVECLAGSNPLPNLKVRSSNSGTTAGFKRYFATLTLAAPWLAITNTPLASEEVKWPMTLELSGHYEACCEKGSQLAALVFSMPGTSGYADLADARNEGFTTNWATHTNANSETYLSAIALIETPSAGNFESPEESGGGSNCKKAKYNEENTHAVEPGADWSEVKQVNVKENASYPICTLTFDLAWNKYRTTKLNEKYGSETKAERIGLTVLHYLSLVIKPGFGQSTNLTGKHYGLLPSAIETKALAGVIEANIQP